MVMRVCRPAGRVTSAINRTISKAPKTAQITQFEKKSTKMVSPPVFGMTAVGGTTVTGGSFVFLRLHFPKHRIHN